MAFVLDDVAGALAAETAETVDAMTAADVEKGRLMEVPQEMEEKGVELDPVDDSVEPANDFFDEFPSDDTDASLEGAGELTDEPLFFDEYPGDAVADAGQEVDASLEKGMESDRPKTYDELCENRSCGGSYKELKSEGWGWNDNPPYEVHHMPADSASYLERGDGPAVAVDYSDHQQTASCGSSREAKEYRARQKEMIDHGDFRGALQMDIDDLHDKFGDKYDHAIAQLEDYVDELEKNGKI